MSTTYAGQFVDQSGQERFLGTFTFTAATPSTPPALNQVSPAGTITSGALPDTGAWVSGTAKVNPTSRDITVYVETLTDGTNNAASCAIAISPDNSTFTTVGTVSVPAAINNLAAVSAVVPVRLPNGWYIKLTFTATRMTVAASYYA